MKQNYIKKLNKFKMLLRRKDGGTTIEASVAIVIFMMILALFLSFFPVVTRTQTINSMAHEMARYIEITGEISNITDSEFERIKAAASIHNAIYSVNKYGKLELQEEFTVTVSSKAHIGIGGIFNIPVDVVGKAAGRSERYWKK